VLSVPTERSDMAMRSRNVGDDEARRSWLVEQVTEYLALRPEFAHEAQRIAEAVADVAIRNFRTPSGWSRNTSSAAKVASLTRSFLRIHVTGYFQRLLEDDDGLGVFDPATSGRTKKEASLEVDAWLAARRADR
jgi:hypothetical protein